MSELLHMIESFLFYNGIGSLVAYIACVAIAVITLIKNPKNKLNILFAIVAFVGSIWNMIVYFIINTNSAFEATIAWRMYSASTILLLTLLMYFCAEVAKKKISLPNIMLTVLILSPLIMFSDLFITGADEIDGTFYQAKSSAFIVLEVYRLFMVTASMYFLYLGYDTSETRLKAKIKYIFIGIGFALVIAVVDILLRVSGENILPFSSLATLVTVWCMSQSFRIGEER